MRGKIRIYLDKIVRMCYIARKRERCIRIISFSLPGIPFFRKIIGLISLMSFHHLPKKEERTSTFSIFRGKHPQEFEMNYFQNQQQQDETWAEASFGGFIATLAIVGTLFLLLLLASPAHAGRYDGTSWSAASQGVRVIPYDPSLCEICRAENGRPSMTECGPPSAMQSGLPYVIFCGGSTWGEAGSAPGTQMIGPGSVVGSFKARSDDYWTVK